MTAKELAEELLALPEKTQERTVCFYGEQGWVEIKGVEPRLAYVKEFLIKPNVKEFLIKPNVKDRSDHVHIVAIV